MIRHACEQDIPVLLEIFQKARCYMRQTGNMTQWSNHYPGEDVIYKDIREGTCYVIDVEGVHGVFTLLSRPDPTYLYIEDGAWLHDGPYGTIHRIASDGTISGVVEQAVRFALQYHSCLRCDTHKDNWPMQRALTAAGFVRCGVIYLENGEPREAYQRG